MFGPSYYALGRQITELANPGTCRESGHCVPGNPMIDIGARPGPRQVDSASSILCSPLHQQLVIYDLLDSNKIISWQKAPAPLPPDPKRQRSLPRPKVSAKSPPGPTSRVILTIKNHDPSQVILIEPHHLTFPPTPATPADVHLNASAPTALDPQLLTHQMTPPNIPHYQSTPTNDKSIYSYLI